MIVFLWFKCLRVFVVKLMILVVGFMIFEVKIVLVVIFGVKLEVIEIMIRC